MIKTEVSMTFEVVVPQMGESVLEGTIVEWKVAVGDRVIVNQALVEIMTDKINVEIPSEVDGVIEKLLVKPDDVVPVGTMICTINTSGEVPKKTPDKKAAISSRTVSPEPTSAVIQPSHPAASDKKSKMAPAVRKLVRDFGLDAAAISGTGPDGRITNEDVKKAAAARSVVAEAQSTAHVAKTQIKTEPKASPGEQLEERIPLAGARKSIAEHMLRSKHTSAHVTTFEECDFTELAAYRNKYKDSFYKTYGARLTYMPFIINASVEALKEFPALNASMTETEIIFKKYYNIGVAVARENGLIVPVLKNAESKSIIDLAIEINNLGERARDDKLILDDVQGGTFTITNAGMFGATASTPIINQPQVAILGVHNISQKPVVRESQIVIRYMSTFGLSFDHRLIDGHTAVQFLHRVIEYIESPTLLSMRLH
ncbi:MAG: dihydrolipoyllysine-residue succinyltransferase [Candidatus Zixiibacteriota bacterium]